jgi:hypothetical protein
MSDLAQIEIERDVAEAATRRAAEEDLTVTAMCRSSCAGASNEPLARTAFLSMTMSVTGASFVLTASPTRTTRATTGAPRCMEICSIAAIECFAAAAPS